MSGHGLLHRLHALAQTHAFEPARDRDIALQILAPDLGLPRFVLEIGQRAERRRLARGLL